MTIAIKAAVTSTRIRLPLGDSGKFNEFDFAELPAELLGMAAINGFIGALNNISRGKDDKGVANSDDVWLAARAKRIDTWLGGNWGSVSRGESAMSMLREQYIDERRDESGMTRKQVEDAIKGTVKQVLGEKTSATFDNFLSAVATLVAKRDSREVQEVRDEIENGLAERAAEAAKKRGEVKVTIDASALGF